MSDTFLNEFLDGSENGEAPPAQAGADAATVTDRVIAELKTIYDPEIPVNIYELGLIYDVDVDDKGAAFITMTLTTPMCPVAESMPGEVEDKVRAVEGVTEAKVNLVWEPPWDMSKLTEAAKLELGML
ncbi:MAG: SUF system Fe-S cluster assembly protein [Alphaproteobacteria bacterium]